MHAMSRSRRRPVRKFIPGEILGGDSIRLESRKLAAVIFQRTPQFTGFHWSSWSGATADYPSPGYGMWFSAFNDQVVYDDGISNYFVINTSGQGGDSTIQFTDDGNDPINPSAAIVLNSTQNVFVDVYKMNGLQYNYLQTERAVLDWDIVDTSTGNPTTLTLSGSFTISCNFSNPNANLTADPQTNMTFRSAGISVSASEGGTITATYTAPGGSLQNFSAPFNPGSSYTFNFVVTTSHEHIEYRSNDGVFFYPHVPPILANPPEKVISGLTWGFSES